MESYYDEEEDESESQNIRRLVSMNRTPQKPFFKSSDRVEIEVTQEGLDYGHMGQYMKEQNRMRELFESPKRFE